jgi:phage terminase Nu1 subunit (DNA packaging protein)
MALPERICTTDLARLFMVSPQNIQNYIKAGMPKHGHGKTGYYVWEEVFPWYRARLQDVALKSVTAKEAEARLDGAYEQALKTKVERERHEIKLARERGEVVSLRDVKRFDEIAITNCKQRLRLIAPKVARKLLAAKTEAKIRDVIAAEVDEALRELVSAADGIVLNEESDVVPGDE